MRISDDMCNKSTSPISMLYSLPISPQGKSILLTGTLLSLAVFYSIPLSVWQEIVFHASQTWNNKHTFWNKTSLHRQYRSTKGVKSWLIFELILLFVDIVFRFWCWWLFWIITSEIAYIWSIFGKVCHGKMGKPDTKVWPMCHLTLKSDRCVS